MKELVRRLRGLLAEAHTDRDEDCNNGTCSYCLAIEEASIALADAEGGDGDYTGDQG